jgi:hypothetical protein
MGARVIKPFAEPEEQFLEIPRINIGGFACKS